MYYGARTRARKVSNPTRRFLLREKGGKEGTGRPMLSIRPGTRGATVVLCTLRRPSPALVHHLAGPRRIVCTAALCWSSSDGRLPRDYESNTVLLCLVRSKRYSSLKFCIWPVLLYSVIIEDYIYVRVLAGLNTGCNNNIIKTYFRGLELGLLQVQGRSDLKWLVNIRWSEPRVSYTGLLLYRCIVNVTTSLRAPPIFLF